MPRTCRTMLALVVLGLVALDASPAGADTWRQTSFLVGGWIPGTPQTAEQLLRMEEAGLDYFHTYAAWLSGNRDVMARLDSLAASRPGFRLKAISHLVIPFDDPGRVSGNDDPARNWPKIRANLAPEGGVNRRSTLGWHLGDEPYQRAVMARLADMTRRLRAYPPTAGQLPFVNLFPAVNPAHNSTYAGEFGKERRAAYAAYLRAWLSHFDDDPDPAPMLSFDHYPFQAKTRPSPEWFVTLAVARDETNARARPAEGKIIPVWAVIQASDHRPRGQRGFARTFNPTQLRWQAWSAVAYGAKGISYWTLAPAEDKGNDLGFDAGIFDARGRVTALLPAMKSLNAELHALGPHLMALDPVGARHVTLDGQEGIADELWIFQGGVPRPLGPLTGVSGDRRGSDALVTLFRHRTSGGDWVFVFNKSLTTTRTFRVELARASGVKRISRSDGKARVVATGATSFSTGPLPPGTGDLFVVAR
jgi:hypothetical protein